MKGILGYQNTIDYSGPKEQISIFSTKMSTKIFINFEDLPIKLQLFLQIKKPQSIQIEFELNGPTIENIQIDEKKLCKEYVDFETYFSICENLWHINDSIRKNLGNSENIRNKDLNYCQMINVHKSLKKHSNAKVIHTNKGCEFTVDTIEDWLALCFVLKSSKSRPCDIMFNIWDGAVNNISMIRAIKYSGRDDPYPTRVISPFASQDRSWNSMANHLHELSKRLGSILQNNDWVSIKSGYHPKVVKLGSQVLATMMLYILDGQGNQAKEALRETMLRFTEEELQPLEREITEKIQQLEASITEFFTLAFGMESSRNLFCAIDTLIHLNNIANGEYNFQAAFSRDGKSLMTGSQGFVNLEHFFDSAQVLMLTSKPDSNLLVILYNKIKSHNNRTIQGYTACIRAYKNMENLLIQHNIKSIDAVIAPLLKMMLGQEAPNPDLKKSSTALPIIKNLKEVPIKQLFDHFLGLDIDDFLNSLKEKTTENLTNHLKLFTNVNTIYNGYLPLQIAIENNFLGGVALLLDHGANPSTTNREGQNSVEYALMHLSEDSQITLLLIQTQLQNALSLNRSADILRLKQWDNIKTDNDSLTNDEIKVLFEQHLEGFNYNSIIPIDVQYNHQDVTWQILGIIETKFVKNNDNQFIICPINFSDIHWASMVVEKTDNITSPNIYFFDSLGPNNEKIEMIDKIIQNTQIFKNAELIELSTEQLIQQSTHSCGTWMIESVKAVLQTRSNHTQTPFESASNIQQILQQKNIESLHQENLKTVRFSQDLNIEEDINALNAFFAESTQSVTQYEPDNYERIRQKKRKREESETDNSKELYDAMIEKRTEIVSQCLQDSIDIDFRDLGSGDTLLHTAIRTANYKVVEHLLDLGIDEEIKNNHNQTAQELLDNMIYDANHMVREQIQQEQKPHYRWLQQNYYNLEACQRHLNQKKFLKN